MGDSPTPLDRPGHQRRPRRVTIADVAERLGVAKGTVSRALNGYPDISEATRRRIERVAKELGYSPLAQAQAIRTGRVRAIGLVLQVYQHDGHRPFLADFLAGIAAIASDERWTLTLANASSRAELVPTLARLIQEHKVDGFILPRTLADDPRANYLREQGVPFVLYGRVENPEDCAWFDIESDVAMHQAVTRLAGQGHQRIGFVHGDPRYTYVRLRRQGYLAGLADAGLIADASLIEGDAVTEAQGQAATAKLLGLAAPPTAIVYATDLAAIGGYAAARDRCLTIGRDLSIIGYDGLPEGARLDPPLTTFAVDNRAAGEELAGLLIRRCRGEPVENLRRTARAALVPGASDGPVHMAQALKNI